MTKIGEMPYLNSEIFYLNRISNFNYINLTPKKMGVAISEMKINAGPISLVDFFKIDNLNLLNNYCVATKKSANSVQKRRLMILKIFISLMKHQHQ